MTFNWKVPYPDWLAKISNEWRSTFGDQQSLDAIQEATETIFGWDSQRVKDVPDVDNAHMVNKNNEAVIRNYETEKE